MNSAEDSRIRKSIRICTKENTIRFLAVIKISICTRADQWLIWGRISIEKTIRYEGEIQPRLSKRDENCAKRSLQWEIELIIKVNSNYQSQFWWCLELVSVLFGLLTKVSLSPLWILSIYCWISSTTFQKISYKSF